MMEETNTIDATASKRPGFLTTLCVLSFIGSGLWALISLIGIFASGPIMGFISGGAMEQMSKDKAVGRIPGATGQGMPEGIKGPPPGTNPMGGN